LENSNPGLCSLLTTHKVCAEDNFRVWVTILGLHITFTKKQRKIVGGKDNLFYSLI